MEKTMGKKVLSLIIAAVFGLTTFAVTGASVDKVYADGVEDLPETMSMTYYPKWKSGNSEWLADESYVKIKMDSVKSSNSSVAKLKHDTYDGNGYYYIKTKKTGKATLTFKAKAPGEDKWTKATIKVKVYKWERPVKTFKIGSKSYKKKFNKKSVYGTSKKVSGKLVIKAKKGWKIDFMEKYDSENNKFVKIKNKQKVTLKKGDDIYVNFKKKGADRYEYIDLYRY